MKTLKDITLALSFLALAIHNAQAFQLIDNKLPLQPSKAFQAIASFTSPDTIRIEYSIAQGYYLYRSKFQFNTESLDYELGEPLFPEAEIMEDAYFGSIETYEHQVVIEIPVLNATKNATPLSLLAISQGCAAEAGVCYQPYTHSLTLLPPEK